MVTGFFSFNKFWVRCFLCLCVFLVACEQLQMSSAPSPSGLATCVPPDEVVNPYTLQSQTAVQGLYQDYRNNFNNLSVDQRKAFSLLAASAQQSSDYRDFTINGTQTVRITITYLDPLLIQYILLNDALVNKYGEDANVFNADLGRAMTNIASRQELLFVITITASSYDPQAYGSSLLTVYLPVAQLTLFNTGTISVPPTHYDHNLDETIIISRGPAYGVVGYPISIISQNNCAQIMDQWTTSLTLDVSSVIVSGVDFKSQFWRILYTPFTQNNDEPLVNQIIPTPLTDPNLIRQVNQPPQPFSTPDSYTTAANWNIYWESMSRHLSEVFFAELNR